MYKSDKKILLFTGNYGSGKTEISVNYASWLASQDMKIKIADLDLVNPYFRCREAREPLEKAGVTVVAPEGAFHSADLPILLPEIRGVLERPGDTAILDVGGDNVGATVLASLSDVFSRIEYEMFFVLNMNRPFTQTVEGAQQIISEIEAASRLKITSLVGNTHLIDETTIENIVEGAKFTGEVGKKLGLPVAFIGVMSQYMAGIKNGDISYPVMPMERLLLPPWLMKSVPERMAVTHSRDRFGQI